MLVTLLNRTQLDVNVVPDRNPLYVELSDGAIRNGYTVKILNKKQEERTFRLTTTGLPGATMKMVGGDETEATQLELTVEPDKLRAVKIYVATKDPKVLDHEKTDFSFDVTELPEGDTSETSSTETVFHTPDH